MAKPSGGLASAIVDERPGMAQVRNHFARNHNRSKVLIEVTLGGSTDAPEWRYLLEVTDEKARAKRPVVAQERVERWSDGEWQQLLLRPDAEDEADPERLTQTALEQISANAAFRSIAEFLGAMIQVHPDPTLIRKPRTEPVNGIDFGDSFLATVAKTNAKTQKARLGRIARALQTAVPRLGGLTVDRDEDGRPHLIAKLENFRAQGVKQDERDLSDGTLRLVAILWSLLEKRPDGGTLLLEEPEISLHEDLVCQLPAMLYRASRESKRQAIVTTHATGILEDEGVGPMEVLLLEPGDEGTTAALADARPGVHEALASGLSLRDFLLADLRPKQLELFGERFTKPK